MQEQVALNAQKEQFLLLIKEVAHLVLLDITHQTTEWERVYLVLLDNTIQDMEIIPAQNAQ